MTCGSGVDSSEAPVGFRGREEDDGVRLNERSPGASSSKSITSWACAERRLEVRARRVYVGYEVLLQNQNERRALGDASEGEEESRREERWRGSL
jgi:hypothetical protein